MSTTKTDGSGIDYKIVGRVHQISMIKKIREVNRCSLLEAKQLYRAMMVFQANMSKMGEVR